MSNIAMQGKVVLVTGAGRGIGRAIAEMMAAYGAKVVVNDPGVSVSGEPGTERPADEVVNVIRSKGGEAVANLDSVADWSGARRMVEAAIDTFGGIDCVVNNAGILRDRIFHQMTAEEFDAVMKVHLYGSFNVSRAAADRFKQQKSGSFVHMTSTSGLIGNFGQANYAAAKMGIVGLSKSIALDMSRYGVRSNCISPFAWSRMGATVPNTPDQEARLAKAMTNTPAMIAPLAVFLGSDASSEVTGQIFAVRRNEIFVMSQPRPTRSAHRGEGWTPETVATHLYPALKPSFVPLDRTSNVFTWDPM